MKSTTLPNETIFLTIRSVIPDPARGEQLVSLWEKQCSEKAGGKPDEQILLAAAVLMTGQQVPSPATALSVAQGLSGLPVLEALAHFALGLSSLSQTKNLSPAFTPIVSDAVQAVSQRMKLAGEHLMR